MIKDSRKRRQTLGRDGRIRRSNLVRCTKFAECDWAIWFFTTRTPEPFKALTRHLTGSRQSAYLHGLWHVLLTNMKKDSTNRPYSLDWARRRNSARLGGARGFLVGNWQGVPFSTTVDFCLSLTFCADREIPHERMKVRKRKDWIHSQSSAGRKAVRLATRA